MLSFDTNILVYALNRAAPEHARARAFLDELALRSDVAVCELVLVEAYVLLRNPSVFPAPCSARAAVAAIEPLRTHPRWRLVDYPGQGSGLMDALWSLAATDGVARRRVFDARLALTLQHHGVTAFATANLRDFGDFGFERVWNPLA